MFRTNVVPLKEKENELFTNGITHIHKNTQTYSLAVGRRVLGILTHPVCCAVALLLGRAGCWGHLCEKQLQLKGLWKTVQMQHTDLQVCSSSDPLPRHRLFKRTLLSRLLHVVCITEIMWASMALLKKWNPPQYSPTPLTRMRSEPERVSWSAIWRINTSMGWNLTTR